MILVRIRCSRCRAVLREIDAQPEDWSGSVEFVRCRRCDMPDPSRLVNVLMASRRASMGMTGVIPWEMLRGPIERARRRGKPSDFAVHVVDE